MAGAEVLGLDRAARLGGDGPPDLGERRVAPSSRRSSPSLRSGSRSGNSNPHPKTGDGRPRGGATNFLHQPRSTTPMWRRQPTDSSIVGGWPPKSGRPMPVRSSASPRSVRERANEWASRSVRRQSSRSRRIPGVSRCSAVPPVRRPSSRGRLLTAGRLATSIGGPGTSVGALGRASPPPVPCEPVRRRTHRGNRAWLEVVPVAIVGLKQSPAAAQAWWG